jgi:hypothetical protein
MSRAMPCGIDCRLHEIKGEALGVSDRRGPQRVMDLVVVARSAEAALHITPRCRLQSLRSFRPTLARSRHLLGDANAAPVLRVRQRETLADMPFCLHFNVESPFLKQCSLPHKSHEGGVPNESHFH